MDLSRSVPPFSELIVPKFVVDNGISSEQSLFGVARLRVAVLGLGVYAYPPASRGTEAVCSGRVRGVEGWLMQGGMVWGNVEVSEAGESGSFKENERGGRFLSRPASVQSFEMSCLEKFDEVGLVPEATDVESADGVEQELSFQPVGISVRLKAQYDLDEVVLRPGDSYPF